MLPMTVARSFTAGAAINYVLEVHNLSSGFVNDVMLAHNNVRIHGGDAKQVTCTQSESTRGSTVSTPQRCTHTGQSGATPDGGGVYWRIRFAESESGFGLDSVKPSIQCANTDS